MERGCFSLWQLWNRCFGLTFDPKGPNLRLIVESFLLPSLRRPIYLQNRGISTNIGGMLGQKLILCSLIFQGPVPCICFLPGSHHHTVKLFMKVHPTVLSRSVSPICLYLQRTVQAGAIPIEGTLYSSGHTPANLLNDELKRNKWEGVLYCCPYAYCPPVATTGPQLLLEIRPLCFHLKCRR